MRRKRLIIKRAIGERFICWILIKSVFFFFCQTTHLVQRERPTRLLLLEKEVLLLDEARHGLAQLGGPQGLVVDAERVQPDDCVPRPDGEPDVVLAVAGGLLEARAEGDAVQEQRLRK